MKRFTKVLALGMTLAMVFGMSVSAAPSPGTYVPGIVTGVDENGEIGLPKGIYNLEITQEDYGNVVAAVDSDMTQEMIAEILPGWKIDVVVDVWNLSINPDELETEDGITTVKVRMPALPDRDDYTYVILHYPTHDWTNVGSIYPQMVAITPVDWENNYWTFKIDSGSPVAFVRLRKEVPVYVPGGDDDRYTGGSVEAVEIPEGIEQGEITKEAHGLGVAAGKSDDAKRQVEEKMSGWTIDEVVDVLDLKVEKPGQVAVTMPKLSDSDKYTYVALHYSSWDFSGYPEVIRMTLADWTTNKWTFNVTSGSPYVFVRLVKAAEADNSQSQTGGNSTQTTEQSAIQSAATVQGAIVSPKTGEALPLVAVMALVCLAGAVACVKKACGNN